MLYQKLKVFLNDLKLFILYPSELGLYVWAMFAILVLVILGYTNCVSTTTNNVRITNVSPVTLEAPIKSTVQAPIEAPISLKDVQLSTRDKDLSDVSKIIYGFLGNIRKDGRYSKVPDISQWIVDAAYEYKIDPILITIVIQAESAFFTEAIGSKGELGLMQVLTPSARKGFDLKKSADQVRAGTNWLAKCLEACNNKESSALQMYQTGNCAGKAFGPKYRTRLAMEARLKLGRL